MSKKTIKGKSLKQIYTLNTMYANNCVEIIGRGNKTYRINVDEFLKLVEDIEFDVETKRKYDHLTIKPKTK